MSLQASTRSDMRGTVAVIIMTAPPMNGLGHAVRACIAGCLEQASAGPRGAAMPFPHD